MTDLSRRPTRCTDLGRRQRCTGKELDQSRLSAAHRCRLADRRRHPGFRPAVRTDAQPAAAELLVGPARQADRRRAGRGSRTLRPDLCGASGHRRQPGSGHGRAHGPGAERPEHQPVRPLKAAGVTDAEALRASVRHSGARLTLAHLPHRHPRALALLLAGRPWHRSAAGREDARAAAFADGGAPACRSHRWLLRRRTLGSTGHYRRRRLHPGDQPVDLA